MKLSVWGHFVKFLSNTSAGKLALLGLIVYVLIATSFGAVYFVSGGVRSEYFYAKPGFLDCIYFSFVTQTTITYGDYRPQGVGKLIFVFHTLVAIMFFSVLVGVIVAKVFLPSRTGIRVSKYVLFQPESKSFRFRFYNTQALALEDVTFSVRLRKPSELGSIILDQFDVELTRTSAPLLSSRIVWILDTKPPRGSRTREGDHYLGSQTQKLLSPADFDEHSQAVLQIRGTFYHSKHITTAPFGLSEIRCGEFKTIQHTPGKIEEGYVDEYERVQKVTCLQCHFRRDCKLCDKWV